MSHLILNRALEFFVKSAKKIAEIAEFAPDSISDLHAWYKSDTNVTHSVGTEQAITSWADVDGNQPLVQAYGPAQPRLVDATHGYAALNNPPDLQNGYPYYAGGQNPHVQGLFTTPLTDPFTLVFVTRYDRGAGGAYAYRYNSVGVANVVAIGGATESMRVHYLYKVNVGYDYTTSSTEATIGTGTLTIVVADDLGWTTGNVIVQADDNNGMSGSITSYTAGTKTLVLNITDVDGSGTFSSWDVQGVSSTFNYTAFPQSTKWDVLVNVYDGAASKSVVNGVDNGSGTMPTPMKHKGLKVAFCQLLEIIAYDKALSTSEIAELSTYLTDKYTETTFQDRWSMYFDGVDEYVDCGDSDVFSFTDGAGADTAFSISMWVYPTGNGGFPSMFSKSSGVDKEYSVYHWSAGMDFTLFDSASNRIGRRYGSALTLNTWQHLCFTYDGTELSSGMIIYLNGSALTTTTNDSGAYAGMTNTTNSFIIGDYNFGDPFEGNIDDVAIWSTELDADTITSIYNSGTPNDLTLSASYTDGSGVDKSGDLKGYWLMGDGATYNGLLALPYTIPDAWAETLYSKNYFYFDGIDDNIRLGATTTSLGITGAISISFWCKMPVGSTTVGPAPIGEDSTGGSTRNWGFICVYNSLIFQVWNTDGTGTNCTSPANSQIQDGNWHHVMGTYDGTSDIELFIDGASVATATSGSTGVRASAQSTYIGGVGSSGTSYNWEGEIDDVAVFNTDKSGSIATIYNSGKPSDLSAEAGLAGYWKFDDATISGQWTVPDSSANSNDGTSNAMGPDNKTYYANTGKLTNGSLINAKMDTP